ncbi:MAG: 5-(carboxyamino)imidazole ribonucleotide synthase [Pseudomonadales bacterium]|jgi:5-(carboxyamino)imidazole ribonucleotide synthase|nr:5-(carboxyamino)imidazole ribonucleotide synthase [Pseudomonadales bacterium]
MKAFYQDFRLGILGGGQLGRMLLQACPNYDVYNVVLDPDADAPCRHLASRFVQGSLTDFDTVYRFGKEVDLLTIEIENVNVAALYQLEREGLTVYPQPRVIDIIQDKRTQKQFYRDHGIPTPDFLLVDGKADIAANLDFLPAFNKLGRGGYDGGGVRRLDTAADLERAFDAPGVLEQLVDFEREISVIAARNAQGEVAVFPAVECVFDPRYNLVDYLLAPSQSTPAVLARAEAIARTVVERLQIVGILAVEMFVTRAGEVLVNEVAPRPHNSGHQTINANYTSQYEQHLRAILDLPLGATALKTPSAMVNVLGAEGHSGLARYEGLDALLAIAGVNLFLYGKKFTRPKRKMGHVTILDTDMERLMQKVEKVKQTIRVVAQ